MRLHRLEAVRGFAAAYVVAHHALPHDFAMHGIRVGYLLRFGQEAVMLFFVLSGFVINYSWAQAPPSVSTYLFNRSARIYIPLAVALFLGYAVDSINLGQPASLNIKILAGNILMLQDVSSLKPGVIADPYKGNSALWSLSYEWWFYILYVPLMMQLRDWRTRTLVVVAIGCLSALLYLWWPHWVGRIGIYLSIWWAGVLLSERFLDREQGGIRLVDGWYAVTPILAAAVVLIAGLVGSGQWAHVGNVGVYPILEIRHLVVAAVFVFMAFAWRALGWFGFSTLIGPFSIFAPISYGIYIFHIPVLVGAGTLLSAQWAVPVAFVLVVLLAAIIELAVYPWLKRGLRRRFLASLEPATN